MRDRGINYERGQIRDLIISEYDMDDILDEFAEASLKRVTADTSREEREWEEYWFDLKDDIVRRALS